MVEHIEVTFPYCLNTNNPLEIHLQDAKLVGSPEHILRFDIYPFISPHHPDRHLAYYDVPLLRWHEAHASATLDQDGALVIQEGDSRHVVAPVWKGQLPLSGYARITVSLQARNAQGLEQLEASTSHPLVLPGEGDSPLEWVQFPVTQYCNLSCPMCSRQRSDAFVNGHVPEDVTRAVLEAAPSIHYLGLQGLGEPMLHPGLQGIVERFRQRMPTQGRIAITTNGTLLTDDLASGLFDAGVNTVTFSVDGASPESYEMRRTGARFDSVCRNIAEATSRARRTGRKDLWLGANMVVDPGNMIEIPEFVQLASRLGLSTVCFFRGREYPSMRITDLDPGLFAQVEEEASTLGKKLGVAVRFARAKTGTLPECPFMCGVYLWLSGEVAPCHRMEPPGYPWPTRLFGNVRNEPLLSIWNRPEFRAFRKGVTSGRLPLECQDCTFTDSVLCGG